MTRDPLTTALLVSTVSIGIAVVTHFTLFHFIWVQRRARALVVIFGVALAGYVWTVLGLDVDRERILCGAVVFGGAFVLYMPFHYTIAASQSVQMLIETDRATKGLTLDELRDRFPVNALLAGRLATMVASGYLLESRGRFALTAKGRAMARSFQVVKALWRLGPGG